MMKRQFFLLAMAAVVLTALPAPAEVSYDIIDLGTLGGNVSRAFSINNSGQIAGWADDSSGNHYATLFDPTGGGNNINLGTLGGDKSDAYSINGSGQIVGRARIASGNAHATLFDPTGGGSNIDLGTLGGTYGVGNSINDDGQIVGRAKNASGNQRATLFDPTGGGSNIDLGTLGGDTSRTKEISISGQIVGEAQDAFGVIRATFFDVTGGGSNIALGDVDTCAYSINSDGQIVGGPTITPPETIYGHATLFDATGEGGNVDLGTLAGYDNSLAWSNNENGQIVGWAYTTTLDNRSAAMFDPTGGGSNINLNNLIDPGLGWHLSTAWDLNDKGWIVGHGTNPDGYEHAYLLTPEPATLLLVGLGGLMLRRKRRV